MVPPLLCLIFLISSDPTASLLLEDFLHDLKLQLPLELKLSYSDTVLMISKAFELVISLNVNKFELTIHNAQRLSML